AGDPAALPIVEPLTQDRDAQVARAAERAVARLRAAQHRPVSQGRIRAYARRRHVDRPPHVHGAVSSRVERPRGFDDPPPLDVARYPLCLTRVHSGRGARTSGVIVEVEAYIGEAEPACHAAPGPTRRNAPLYGAPGHAYVYLNYGIHCLVNVVTESHGSPAAVLIRALDPLDGIDVMRRRRARAMKGRRRMSDAASIGIHDLCRGPGNLPM